MQAQCKQHAKNHNRMIRANYNNKTIIRQGSIQETYTNNTSTIQRIMQDIDQKKTSINQTTYNNNTTVIQD